MYPLQIHGGAVRNGTLLVDGREAGTVKEGSVMIQLSSEEWLTEKRIGLRVENTCGQGEIPLHLDLSRSVEEERRKRSRVGGSGADLFRIMDGLALKAGEVPVSIVYLDNRAGKPTQVTIGKQAVPVESTGKVTVLPGDCPEARAIKVGDKQLGELSPAGKATLVDVAGKQCTMLQEVRYVTTGMNLRNPPKKEERLAGKRTYEVPLELNYFFRTPPSELPSGGSFSKALWSLNACR